MQRGLLICAALAAVFLAVPAYAAAPVACEAYRAEPVTMTDPALCASLEKKVRKPSALPLGEYEAVLNAYGARDSQLAIEVIKRDEKLDTFYNSLFRNLVTHMMENPATISSAAQLLFVARNLERIGDHATNVAEMVYFAATGLYYSEKEGPRATDKVI